MAKGHSKGDSANANDSSLTTLLSPTTPLQAEVLSDSVILNQLYHGRYDDGDRRYHFPEPTTRPAMSLRRAHAMLTLRGFAREVGVDIPKLPRMRPGFANPRYVGICVRRKVRREVLHALGKTRRSGKGGSRRRNQWSDVRC